MNDERRTVVVTMTAENGDVRETRMAPAQGRDCRAGRAVAYYPRDEQVLVDDDGRITVRESAIPKEKETQHEHR